MFEREVEGVYVNSLMIGSNMIEVNLRLDIYSPFILFH